MNRQILLIGIGRLGCSAVDAYKRSAHSGGESVHALTVDTDIRTAEEILAAEHISMASHTRIADILESTDTDKLGDLFPCDKEKDSVEYFEVLSMNEGANGWRMKATLAFYHFLESPKNSDAFHAELDKVAASIPEDAEDKSIELLVVSSLAGGTGSGLLIPLTLYIKRYFGEKGIEIAASRAMLALPDMLEDQLTPEQKVKAEANAYATLREINAMNLASVGESVSFKIGKEDDKVLGVLYDSADPAYTTPEAMLFSHIYLFRRIPGIRSLLFHIDYIADAIRTIMFSPCTKASEPTTSVYDLFTLTKTVYPTDSLTDYLSRRHLTDMMEREWLPFSARTAKLFSAELGMTYTIEKAEKANASELASATLAALGEICPEESDTPISAILSRKADPASPDAPFSDEYYDALDDALDAMFCSDPLLSLERCMTDAKAKVSEYGKKDPIFKRSGRKKENIEFILACKRYLTDYYNLGLSRMAECEDEARELLSEDSDLFLDTLVSREGRAYHPAYATLLLSTLYVKLEEVLEYRRRCDKSKDRRLTAGDIPEWLLSADTSVRADCSYDTGSRDRLAVVFSGKTRHVGSAAANMSLVCHDVGVVLARMKNIFKSAAIEAILPMIGERLCAYYNAMRALAGSLEDEREKLSDVENSYTGKPGTIYYVGATADEKKSFYKNYIEYLSDKKDNPLTLVLDGALGEAFLALTKKEDADAAAAVRELLSHERENILADPDTRVYYERETGKNILELLLTKDASRGGDASELALRKAFCAGPGGARFYLPDTPDSYLLMQALSKRVTAELPIEARDYLTAQGRDPESFVGELLYNAGEYEGNVVFDDYLGAKELRIVRETANIDLTMIEYFSETSEMPLYYRSYIKALAMEKEQMTALWSPHLLCGYNDDSLPAVSREMREIKIQIGKEEDDPC